MATDTARTQRRRVRDEATIDHLVQGVYQPKDADQKQTVRSPTTSTGVSIEDQVRKEWDPARWAVFQPSKSSTSADLGIAMFEL